MLSESLKRIALFDALETGQGFAGGLTAPLFRQALEIAGYQTLDGALLLGGSPSDLGAAPEAWISLRAAETPDKTSSDYCRSVSIPYFVVDPLLTALSPDTNTSPTLDAADAVACCFPARAEPLSAGMKDGKTALHIEAFLDPASCFLAQRGASATRQNLSQRHRLPGGFPWIYLSAPGDSNVESLISTFETLSRLAMLEWNLIVCATGESRSVAEQLLPRLPAKDRFLISDDNPAERHAFLAASDIFLGVERDGGMVHDILEGLASGLAVVANKSPAVEAVVENGVTGRLSAAGNPASLSNDLSFLLRHDNFLQSYRGNSRGQIVARHDIMIAAQALAQWLENPLADSPGSL
jgi:hypothetical protein